MFRKMRSSMGSNVKAPAKVDRAVEAYLMLLCFVFVKLSGECQREGTNEGEVTVMFLPTQLPNSPQRTCLRGPDFWWGRGAEKITAHTRPRPQHWPHSPDSTTFEKRTASTTPGVLIYRLLISESAIHAPKSYIVHMDITNSYSNPKSDWLQELSHRDIALTRPCNSSAWSQQQDLRAL